MTFLQEKIIAALVILLFVAGLFFNIGDKHATRLLTAKYEKQIADITAAQNQALAAAAEQEKAIMQKQVANVRASAAADQQHQATAVKTRVIYKTIHDQVTKYVQTHPASDNCSLDADGLRLWNAANRGQPDLAAATTSDSAGHTAGQVPTAASSN